MCIKLQNLISFNLNPFLLRISIPLFLNEIVFIVEFLFNSYSKSFFSANKQIIATVRAGNVIGGGDYSLDRLIPDIIKSFTKNKKIMFL